MQLIREYMECKMSEVREKVNASCLERMMKFKAGLLTDDRWMCSGIQNYTGNFCMKQMFQSSLVVCFLLLYLVFFPLSSSTCASWVQCVWMFFVGLPGCQGREHEAVPLLSTGHFGWVWQTAVGLVPGRLLDGSSQLFLDMFEMTQL